MSAVYSFRVTSYADPLQFKLLYVTGKPRYESCLVILCVGLKGKILIYAIYYLKQILGSLVNREERPITKVALLLLTFF